MSSWAGCGWSSLISLHNNTDSIELLLADMAARSILLFTFASQASTLAANQPPVNSLRMSVSLKFASPFPLHRHRHFSFSWLPLLQHHIPLSSFSPSPCRTLSCLGAMLQTLSTPSSLSPFTCWCKIPMQLPILYSMSSSGEVTRALHGWQSTLLQNCIIRSQSQHRQSRQICGAAVCASPSLPVSHSG